MASTQFTGIKGSNTIMRTSYPFTTNPQIVNTGYRGLKRMGTFESVSNNLVSARNINASLITAGNIKVYNIISNSERLVQQLTLSAEEVLTIDPNDNRTFIAQFNTIDNSEGAFESSLDVILDNCLVGDQLILMFKFTGGNNVRIFLSDNFYYTACGDFVDNINFDSYERWVITFTYDGEKFVNTEDNC